MNVKNLDKFLEDIDQENIIDWDIQTDCHKKIKKIKLFKKTALREKEFAEEIQITLENNPRYYETTSISKNPEKQWEIPSRELASRRHDKEMLSNTVSLPEEMKKEMSEILEHPVYDGMYYYDNGEKELG